MSNLIRPSLRIPSDLWPDAPKGFLEALNDRLDRIGTLHEASAGLRGTVNVAKQKATDQRGTPMPGFDLKENRIANVGDPIDAQDVATRKWVLDQLTCENLSEILEECNDFDDAMDFGGDETTTGTTVTEFWPLTLTQPQTATLTGINSSPQNKLFVWPFYLPFICSVNRVTWENGTGSASSSDYASMGLYDSNKTLVMQATNSIELGGIKTITLSTVNLVPGFYWYGITTMVGDTFRCISASGAADAIQNFLNHVSVVCGQSGTTSGGVLPASFGTVTATLPTSSLVPPISRFWKV